MRELRLIRSKLQNRKNSLLSTDYSRASNEIRIFIKFIEDDPIIRTILNSLPPSQIDLDLWANNLWGATDIGFPDDEAERASMCLAILKKFRSSNDLVQISHNFHVSTNNITQHVQAYLETIVPPLYQYIDEKLIEKETMITPVDIAEEMQSLVDNQIGPKFPATHSSLTQAYKNLFTGESPESWSGIANMCRTALINLADEAYISEYLPEGADQPKQDNAKDKLKYTLRYKLKSIDEGARYIEARESLIKTSWDFINVVIHRKSKASHDDAKECVLLTYMVVATVGSLFDGD